MQKDVGLQVATDGEFRRASWHMDFIYQLGGVVRHPEERLTIEFHSDEGDLEAVFSGMHVEAPLGLSHTIFGDDFAFLRDAVERRHAEAHDPVAEHGPLPRRAGIDRSGGVPGARRLLGRPDRGVPRGGAEVG